MSGHGGKMTSQTASLHSFSGSSKRVMIPDENGFPRYYACDDPIVQYIRTVAQSGHLPTSAPHMMTGQGSLGSLPSGASVHSSQASVASNVSSTPSFGQADTRYYFSNFFFLKLASTFLS